MTHTTEKWYVGYDQEYDIDAGDDGRTIGYPTGRDKFDGTIFMVDGEDQIEIIAEHIRDEKTALRIAALWNMAERLRLTTEEIKAKESMFRAAADMLKALEWYEWKVDEHRKNTLEGDRARYDLDRDGGSRAYAAIQKARGEDA